jgi:hypothetical protein
VSARLLKVLVAAVFLVHATVPHAILGQEKKPYSIEELERLLKSGVISDQRITELLYENGLTFYPDDQAVGRLIRAGASNQVIEAVRNAEHPPAPAKEKKPFYKKWWVMGAAAVVLGGAAALAASGGGDGDGDGDGVNPLPNFPDHP